MANPYEIFRILLKFMDFHFVDSFLTEGLLFMNNVEFFRKYEDSDFDLRGDADEGLSATYVAKNLDLYVGDHKIEGAVGKVDVRYNHADETNIFSMTKISDGNIIDAGDEGLLLSQKFLNFGDRALIITGKNILEFEKRLKAAVIGCNEIFTFTHDNVIAKQVEYLDRDNYHGELNIFNKFKKYRWQYEWRIALKQRVKKGPYCLKLGDLSDIVTVCKTKDIVNTPIKLFNKMD